MKHLRCAILFLVSLSLLLFSPTASEGDQTYSHTIITPHIGEGWESIEMKFNVEGDAFTTYLVADALFNLDIRDARGPLTYTFGKPVLFGKRRYVPLTVNLHGGKSEFEISYDRETMATGTTISGEYWYYLKRTTDIAVVEYHLPLETIEVKTDTEPAPDSVSYGNPTIVTYRIMEGDIVMLTTRYVRRGGIDYERKKTIEETARVAGKEYAFILTYPEDAEELADDVRFFIREMFPRIIEEAGYPLSQSSFAINLKEKGEVEWAAAVNRGGGTIEFYIETPHSYPSTVLPHEFIHSYIRGIPTFVNEGLANYFEWNVLSDFVPDLGTPDYAPPEWYWQTYERQYGEFVDIRTDYGESGTDKLESLIYSKYDKGTYLITLIAHRAGEDTVREMLQIIARRSETTHGPISLDYVVSHLSGKRAEVFEIFTGSLFRFDLTDPEREEALRLLRSAKNDSWLSALIVIANGYEKRLRLTPIEDVDSLLRDIEQTREIARRTYHVMTATAIVGILSCILAGVFLIRRTYRAHSPSLKARREWERVNLLKLRLAGRVGTMHDVRSLMAARFGWENREDDTLVPTLAQEMGVAE